MPQLLTAAAACLMLTAVPADAEFTYTAHRLNHGQPLITQQTFTDVDPAFSRQGANINGPSVIRVPDWIDPAERPDPEANYYLYFGDHGGTYIRMAWAQAVDGPYTLYGMHLLSEHRPRGVLDMGGDRRIDLAHGLGLHDHIASPDVHVNHNTQQIEMYFHGPAYHDGSGGGGLAQRTFHASSDTGLEFDNGITPVALGLAYMRVFPHDGKTYGIASRGAFYRAAEDPLNPPANFDHGNEYWSLVGSTYEDNPLARAIDADPNGPDRLRHAAVLVDGDRLHVFHTRVGDRPERVLLSTIELSDDPTTWESTYPPIEILEPELDWEGVNQPLAASRGGAQTHVRQLRDPYVFQDVDGQLYLFYSGAGEQAIGVAKLVQTQEPAPAAQRR
jgi:hypothetical protein